VGRDVSAGGGEVGGDRMMNIFYVANIDLSVEGAMTRHIFEVCENLINFGHAVNAL